VLKRVAISLYSGGSDTTVSANTSFFLLMGLHPEVQRKAQEEIDRVIGHDRLPNAQDRKNLPYVDAIMREVMRLDPVLPLGEFQCGQAPLDLLTGALAVPHRLKEDDVYEGMLSWRLIPRSLNNVATGYHFTKDTIFYPNNWCILHNEALYPDPFTFNPDRFMQPAKDEQTEKLRDPFTYAFGYGRRICPGMHLAIDSMFVTIAMSLATLNIDKKKDANGQCIEPQVEYSTGTIRYVFPVTHLAAAIF